MDLPWKELLGAAVTLFVALLGYRQWSRTRRSGGFLRDREAAYKAVWGALERANLAVRDWSDVPAVDAAVRDVNVLLMTHALHLEAGDLEHARQYLTALQAFAGQLHEAELPDESARSLAVTATSPTLPASLLASWSRFESARDVVIAGFRKALGAGA